MSDPSAVSSLVIACAVLHNMAIMRGIDLDINNLDNIPQEMAVQPEIDVEDGRAEHRGRPLIRGIRARNQIVEGFFSRN